MNGFILYKTATGISSFDSKLFFNAYTVGVNVVVLTTNGRQVTIPKATAEEAEVELNNVLSNINASNVGVSGVYMTSEVCTQVDLPSEKTVQLDGGTSNAPTLLSYGTNNINSINSTNSHFILPEPKTGGVVEIISTAKVEYFVSPPNSVSTIDAQETGLAVRVSSGELNAKFTCVQNPTVSVWVSTTTMTNVMFPLGNLSIFFPPDKLQNAWFGNSSTVSTGAVGLAAGSTALPAGNYDMTTTTDVYSLTSNLSNIYKITGFRLYTDMLETDLANELNWAISMSTFITCVIDQNELESGQRWIDPTGKQGGGSISINAPDIAAGFSPSNHRYSKTYFNASKGGNCVMLDASGVYNKVVSNLGGVTKLICSNQAEPNAPDISISPTETKKEYGQGAFQILVNIAQGQGVGSPTLSGTYSFRAEVDVDLI